MLPAMVAMAGLGSGDSAELRVMVFNVLTGGNANSQFDRGSALHGKSRVERIGEIVEESGAEVVFVCEEYGNAELRSVLEGIGLKRLTSGPRGSAIYSSLPGLEISTSLARIQWGEVSFVAKVEHWPPSPYGPMILQEAMAQGGHYDERWLLAQSDKGRFYVDTYRSMHPFLNGGNDLIMGGDFNEPSHLDWTERYEQEGADRWVENALSTPLRMKVGWKGSRMLTSPELFAEELGVMGDMVKLTDAYRQVHPDEVARPGDTWTPRYANGTAGRRMYNAAPTDEVPVPLNQVNDRIDLIYYRAGKQLVAKEAWVVGEVGSLAEVRVEDFPSDHRAVVVVFGRR